MLGAGSGTNVPTTPINEITRRDTNIFTWFGEKNPYIHGPITKKPSVTSEYLTITLQRLSPMCHSTNTMWHPKLSQIPIPLVRNGYPEWRAITNKPSVTSEYLTITLQRLSPMCHLTNMMWHPKLSQILTNVSLNKYDVTPNTLPNPNTTC